MKYKILGRSGLRVSELCLGTMTFGEDWKFGASREVSRAIFDAYSNEGGNFIDAANTYTNGTSEKLVGEFIRQERRNFILSTKYSLSTDHHAINAGGNHRKSLRHAVEDSLQRLDTDYIDILWVHAWDGLTPIDETMRALDDLVRAGKVLYIGASNMPAWVVSQAQTMAELKGWSRFIGLQTEYSLIERSAEHELLPMAEALGIGVLGWAPLGGGVLTGKYVLHETEVRFDDTARGGWLNKERIDHRTMSIATEVQAMAGVLQSTPSQVALAWMRQNGRNVIPIIGARTLKQCEENLASLDVRLTDAQIQKLDALSASAPLFPQKFLESRPLRQALFGNHEDTIQNAPAAQRRDDPQAEIHAVATIQAKAGKRADLAAAFRDILEKVKSKNGCIEYDLATPLEMEATGSKPANGNEIILVERWKNRESLESHLADTEYRDWFNTIRPLIETASMTILQKDAIC